MLRRSFSSLRTAAESLAASEIKANKFIDNFVEPLLSRKAKRGSVFTHVTSTKHPQLWDTHLADSVVSVLQKKGYNVTYQFYQHKPCETVCDGENGEIVLYIDWRDT